MKLKDRYISNIQSESERDKVEIAQLKEKVQNQEKELQNIDKMKE